MTELATGPRLKAERERRGLSSQKAADELHLDGWVIDALEAENFDRIGPSVYARGHLRRYATLLGLPADEIMAGYESRAHAPKPASTPIANVRLRTESPAAVSHIPWPRIAGGAAVLLLAVGVLWWKPWHRHGAAAVNSVNVPVNQSAASAERGNRFRPGRGRRCAACHRHRDSGERACRRAARFRRGPCADDPGGGRCDCRSRQGPPAPEFLRRLVGGRA